MNHTLTLGFKAILRPIFGTFCALLSALLITVVPVDAAADAYSVLGVPRTASFAQIRQAYRSLVKEFHPDLHGGHGNSELLGQVIKAYKELREKHEKETSGNASELAHPLAYKLDRYLEKSADDHYGDVHGDAFLIFQRTFYKMEGSPLTLLELLNRAHIAAFPSAERTSILAVAQAHFAKLGRAAGLDDESIAAFYNRRIGAGVGRSVVRLLNRGGGDADAQSVLRRLIVRLDQTCPRNITTCLHDMLTEFSQVHPETFNLLNAASRHLVAAKISEFLGSLNPELRATPRFKYLVDLQIQLAPPAPAATRLTGCVENLIGSIFRK